MPANTLGYCTVVGNRNCLTVLGALQPQDKFNPVLAGGIPLNNVNLVQPPNLSTQVDQNKLSGFLGGF